MSVEINFILGAFAIVTKYCSVTYTVEEAKKLGIDFKKDDVFYFPNDIERKNGFVRGYKCNFDENDNDFPNISINNIKNAWRILGYKDNEFVSVKRIALDYINMVNVDTKENNNRTHKFNN